MDKKAATRDDRVKEMIGWAESCFRANKERLLEDPETREWLSRLEKAAGSTREELHGSGVAAECRSCEEWEGGSCCGAGIEIRYDGILLLINLLLGVTLPEKRVFPDGCFFLGRSGCLLAVRQVICVNYLCEKLSAKVDPKRLALLREKEGEELEILFRFHDRLKRILADD